MGSISSTAHMFSKGADDRSVRTDANYDNCLVIVLFLGLRVDADRGGFLPSLERTEPERFLKPFCRRSSFCVYGAVLRVGLCPNMLSEGWKVFSFGM